MNGEVLWEVFRKHLREIEKEGGDLTALIKEVRQTRDHLVSVLSESARTQEEIMNWFAGIQRISASTAAQDPETARPLVQEKKSVLEENFERIDKALQQERQAAAGRGAAAERERAEFGERMGILESGLQSCREGQAELEKKITEIHGSLRSVQETIRLLEEFFDRIYRKMISLPRGNNVGALPAETTDNKS
jgi:chromosome segregation ATPase